MNYVRDRIHCARACSNDFLHLCSSVEFYSKQMRWSLRTVSNFWVGLPKHSTLFPQDIPEEIRFCLSWILGSDVTEWPTQKIYSWLCHNLGGSSDASLSHLQDISMRRLTHPSSIHVLLAPPPVKYRLNGPARRYDFSIRHYTELEREAIASLWFMPFVVISRPYGMPRTADRSHRVNKGTASAANVSDK